MDFAFYKKPKGYIQFMAKAYNQNLKRLLELTREMLALSDEGDRDRLDDSCGILYGILRDAGYRLRKLAEQEIENHKRFGNLEE